MEDNEQKSSEQLWQELFDITNEQLETHTQLKQILEPLTGASSRKKGAILNEEVFSRVQDIFIELEALQAEARAVYHNLFGTKE
jgi:hypothetical protein